ncbi:hypothetical protein QQ045_022310 [Rhodiola kirilowii]
MKGAAASSTSLFSKLAPTTSLRLFNLNSSSGDSTRDQDKDGLYIHMKIPKLKIKKQAIFSVEQNTMIVITRGIYYQVKMPGLEKGHFQISVEQNKMILTEQAGSEGESGFIMVDLPPNQHKLNGTKGELKDGVWVTRAGGGGWALTLNQF